MSFQNNHIFLQDIIGQMFNTPPPVFDNSEILEWLEEMAVYYSENPNERHGLFYNTTARANELRTHFNFDAEIADTISRKRPTEQEVYLHYREQAWEPITASWTHKAVNFLNKLFNPQLSKVEFNEFSTPQIPEGEDLKTYLTEKLPKYDNESNFVRNFVLRSMLQDPDGWIVVRSKTPIELRDNSQFPDPFPQYIPSEAVIEYGDDFLFLKSPEHIELKDGELGNVFFAFTKGGTYRLDQVGKQSDFQFEIIEIDRFEENTIAAKQLKGIPKLDFEFYLTDDCKVEYDSHLQPMVPFLNKLMQLASDIDAMLAMHVYLQKMEVKTKCKTCNGKKYIEHMGQQMICPTCNGEGYDKVSIFDTMRIGQDAFKQLGGLPELVKYVKIPTDIIQLVFDREEKYKQQAFEVVNMDFLVRKEVSGVESAKKVQLEQVPLHVMLGAIAKDVFETAQFIADWINLIRYKSLIGNNISENRAIYKAPDRFDIQSAIEAIEELEKASGMESPNTALLAEMTINAARTKYGIDSSAYKSIRTEVELDPLFGMDQEKILNGLDSGIIPSIDVRVHFNLRSLLCNLRELNPDFDDLPKDEKRALLYGLDELEEIEE